MKITTDQMRSLPDFINDIIVTQGRRHRLSTILGGISAGAVLCGMRSYETIDEGVDDLSQNAREHFGCRYHKGRYIVPSLSIFRNLQVRVDPAELEEAFRRWNEAYAQDYSSLAIDGSGGQTQIMSTVGHHTCICCTQKKVGTLPAGKGSD